ncbi:MAG: Hsp20/alpha crystallin family protein [Dehalococcoidia bacterium]
MAFSDFDHLHEHIERMWGRLTGGGSGHSRFRPSLLEPPTDVYQTADAIVVVVEITGMRGQDVELSITDGRLTVRGEKKEPHHHPDRVYMQMEIGCGPFERTVTLPAPVDADQASVQYSEGLLEITLPKRRPVTAQRITVTVAPQG